MRVLGWIPHWDQKRAAATFRKNVGLFDTVGFFWYFIGKKGRIRTYRGAGIDAGLVAFAQDNGVKALAVVTNSPDDGKDSWDRERVKRIIGSPERRARHIDDLVRLATETGFDGINIDYEALDAADRESFSEFVKELADALHAEGKILAVALHPKTGEFLPAEDNGSHAQDWGVINEAADQLHLMTYGHHNSGTPPGPAAPPDWTERVVQYAVAEGGVSSEKLFVGIPLYGEVWRAQTCDGDTCYKGTNRDATFSDVRDLMDDDDATPEWSEEHETPYLRTDDKVIWFENAHSITHKLEMIRRNRINNVAFWRLGGEDADIWPLVEQMSCGEQTQAKRGE